MRTRVKICCIRSIDEANLAVRAGADAIGMVGPMPSGDRQVSDDLVQEIAAAVPPAIGTFLLTSRVRAEDIVDHVRYCGVNTVQIVQHLDPGESEKLARLLPPAVRRVQVVHVEGIDTLKLIAAYEPHVHAFLLDSGRPNLPAAEFGGTGRVHDWHVSAQLVQRSGRPVFLAGGLSPDNVAEAITTVRPFGVDVCTGLRPQRALDGERLRLYFEAIRHADSVG